MQRVLVIVGIGLVVAAAWLLSRPDGDRPGPDGLQDPASTPSGPPTLQGQPAKAAPTVPEAPAPLRSGAGAIKGHVFRGTSPAEARIEVRDLAGANTDTLSLTRPMYAAGPPLASTTSGEDGAFLVADLPVAAYEVRAIAADGAVGWARAFCRAREPVAQCYVRLIDGSDVLDARATYADGRPFRGGVSVMFVGGPSNQLPDVETDDEGHFRIPGMPTGPFWLRFFVPGVSCSWFTDLEAPLAAGRVFVVDEGLQAYTGRVIADDTGEGIAGAALVYDSRAEDARRYTASAVSGDDGGFEVVMPAPTAQFEIRAEGFATMRTQNQQDKPLVFRLKRMGHLVGRVVTQGDASPVAGVPVHGWNWHTYDVMSPLATSDADGRFEADAGPGQGMIYAFGAGWVSAVLSQLTDRGVNPSIVQLGQGARAEVVVEVVRAGRVEGRVVGADGEPIAGLAVGLQLPPRWAGFQQTFVHGELCSAVTSSDGRFVIDHLIPGFTYTVVTRPLEGLPGESAPFTAASDETAHIEIRIAAPRWLTVRVIDKATGQPIPAATVMATQQPRNTANGATAADGTVRIGPLLPGALTLLVRHPDYMSPSGSGPYGRGQPLPDPGPAPEVHVVALEAGGFMAGSIVGEDGAPVESGYLGIYAVGQAAGRSLGLTGLMPLKKGGAFRVGPVPQGAYDLVLVGEMEGLRWPQISRWTAKTGDENLRLVVDPSLTEKDEDHAVFLVLGPDGAPASGHVRLLSPTQYLVNTSWLREGRFVCAGVALGTTVWIEIRGPKDAAGTPLAGVVHGPVKLERGTHEIRLAAAPQLTGRVLGPDDKPVAGLLVQTTLILPSELTAPSSTFAVPAVRTDEAGTFTLAGGAAGSRLVLELPAAYALTPPVELGPGQQDVEIRLVRGQAMDITVRSDDGAPLAGAQVTVSIFPTPTPPLRKATSDAKGVARIEGLAPGATYALVVEPPPGRTDLVDERLEAWPAANTVVTLPGGQVIEGRAQRGTSGEAWASVWWQDPRGLWRKVQADNGGRFRLTVPAGATVAVAAGSGRATSRAGAGAAAQVEAGAKDVVLQVPK